MIVQRGHVRLHSGAQVGVVERLDGTLALVRWPGNVLKWEQLADLVGLATIADLGMSHDG